MPPKKNGGYRAGQIDQILSQLQEGQGRIEGKLDANLEWQRGVDTRLASGSVRLEQLEKQGDDHAVKIVALEISDRKWGGAAVVVAAAFAAIGSVVGTVLGIRR
jgi:hypothetical protein